MNQKYNKEYSGVASNSSPYYSNMTYYGSEGRYRPIIPPSPVTIQPQEFNLLRPHKMPIMSNMLNTKRNDNRNNRCVPYGELNNMCNM
jgi:hypothetical protein